MTILTRHKWLGLAEDSGWSRMSCSTRVRLSPTWTEARMMIQSGWVSALRAHLSQWNWLGTGGQQSSHTGHVLIYHTERGSAVGVSEPDMRSDQSLMPGKGRWGHRWSERAKLILSPFCSGFDAFQWACWPPPSADPGSGGRTVPHSLCSPEGQLLQRVPVRALQPHRGAVHPVTEPQLQGLTLLMIPSHRASHVGAGPGACSESSSSVLLCQTQEQKPQTGHPGSKEPAEHHSSEVDSDIVPAA